MRDGRIVGAQGSLRAVRGFSFLQLSEGVDLSHGDLLAGCVPTMGEEGAHCIGAAPRLQYVAARLSDRRNVQRYSLRRFLRPRPANRRSNSALGSTRRSLATIPICHGITR